MELRGFEPRTSCMPWEIRKFNCRRMPARDGPCGSSRTGRGWKDGQMTVQTILKQAMDQPTSAGSGAMFRDRGGILPPGWYRRCLDFLSDRVQHGNHFVGKLLTVPSSSTRSIVAAPMSLC